MKLVHTKKLYDFIYRKPKNPSKMMENREVHKVRASTSTTEKQKSVTYFTLRKYPNLI